MRYVRFDFENFRGIRHANLNLGLAASGPQIYTLVGLNESGKTTILEAIESFSPTQDDADTEVGPRQLAGWVPPEPDDLVPISERTNFNGKISIHGTIQLDEDDDLAIRKHVRQKTGFRVASLTQTVDVSVVKTFQNSRFVRTTTQWQASLGEGFKRTGYINRPLSAVGEPEAWRAAVEAIRGRLPKIWYFPNFLFEFPQRVVLTPPHDPSIETATNRFYRQLFQDILDSLGKGLKVDEHVVRRALSGDSADLRSLRQLLLDVSREVTNSVIAAWGQLFESDNELGGKRVTVDLAPGAPGEVAIEFFLEDSDGLFGIHERSLGFRWFFVYLLLTHYRGRRRQGESDILFLFDEPASNLHSTAQAALLDSLERLAAHACVVYTTHSHHLINPAWLRSTFVVMNNGVDPRAFSAEVTARRTDIRIEGLHHFAAQHPERSYYFQPVLDVLDYAPSQLEPVPDVVMVEGKTDYYMLRYFLSRSTDSPQPTLHLLPGTGAGSLLTLIQLYMAWSRRFVVLLDNDRGGDTARRRYEEQLGPLLSGRVVDLATACGDPRVRAIESVLAKEDVLAFQRLVDADSLVFKKKVFSQGLLEAVAAGRNVELSNEAVNRLGQTVACLSKMLKDQLEA